MISVTPHEAVWALRRLKRDRQPQEVLKTMRRWHERWVARQGDIAYRYPKMEWRYDHYRMRPEAWFYFDYAVLPEGLGKFVLPDTAGLNWVAA